MALSIGELVGYVDLDTGGMEKGLDKVSGLLSSKGGKWGLALGGIGAAVGGLFASSLAGAMDVEPARDRVAAALDLTTAQADRAGKVAGKVYADGWGESADDVAGAVEAVMSSIKGMRNASESELQGVTTAAMVFAQAMEVDVSRAAQVAGNMVNNGLAKNATQAFDLLTEASSRVPKELRQDVLDATDEYGQFFNTLGIKGPQAMALLAKGASKGMYGIDKAGDAIKEFTIRSTDMSTTSKAAYKAIGLDAHTMANDILAGGNKSNKAFNKIIDGVLGIQDPTKRSNTAIALFGTQMEDLGVKDVPKFLRSLKTGTKGLDDWRGATKRAGDTMSDNAANNIETFKRTLSTAFVQTLGGKVLPLVTSFTGKLADDLGPALDTVGAAVSKVTGFLSRHTSTAKALAGVIGALVAVTAVHAAVLAVSAAGGMAAWLRGTKLISAATKVWTAVQWALDAAMAANPIGLVVIAIAALIAIFILAYKKSETFRKIVTKAMDGVKHAAQAVGAFFTKKLPEFFAKAWEKAKDWTSKGVSKIVGWVTGLPGKIVHGLSSLRGKLGGVFSAAMSAAKDKVVSIGGRIRDWIAGIPGKLASLAGRFGSAGRELLQRFIDGMKNAAGIISGIAGNVWNAVRGLINGAIGRINAALDFTIHLPGPDLHVDIPNIPMLATGGRATGATLAMIGEGREPESVLPDSVLRGLLERAHAAGRDSAQQSGNGRTAPLIGQVVQQPGEDADVLAERLWFKTRTRG